MRATCARTRTACLPRWSSFIMSVALGHVEAQAAAGIRPKTKTAEPGTSLEAALVVDRIESEEALAALKAD